MEVLDFHHPPPLVGYKSKVDGQPNGGKSPADVSFFFFSLGQDNEMRVAVVMGVLKQEATEAKWTGSQAAVSWAIKTKPHGNFD